MSLNNASTLPCPADETLLAACRPSLPRPPTLPVEPTEAEEHASFARYTARRNAAAAERRALAEQARVAATVPPKRGRGRK
jgi:hypothetical protein